jgi:molybdenum cofactor biosynthesis enzyme MoaA
MNSVGTGVTVEKAWEIIDAGLGAWNFSVDTLDPVKYEKLRGVRNALPTIMTAIDTVRRAGADNAEFRMNYMTVITRSNFREIPALVAHCLDTGIASIYLMNVYGDTTGASLLSVPEASATAPRSANSATASSASSTDASRPAQPTMKPPRGLPALRWPRQTLREYLLQDRQRKRLRPSRDSYRLLRVAEEVPSGNSHTARQG